MLSWNFTTVNHPPIATSQLLPPLKNAIHTLGFNAVSLLKIIVTLPDNYRCF